MVGGVYMRCFSCGRELDDGANFCVYCGVKQPDPSAVDARQEVSHPVEQPRRTFEPVQPVQPAQPVPPSQPVPPVQQVQQAPKPEPTVAEQPPVPSGDTQKETPKPKKTIPWKIVAGVAAVLLIVACVGILGKPGRTYDAASAEFEAGNYREAAELFEELGDYEDSQEMRKKALVGVSAQEYEAKAGEDPDTWKAAADAYGRLGEGLPERKAETCRNNAAYYTAKQAMEKEDWAAAKKAFGDLSEEDFEDIPSLVDECDAHISYNKAEGLLADGKYYEAYELFNSLTHDYSDVESLPDCEKRAEACIQDFPGDGAVYTNPDYSSTPVPLTIKNGGAHTFMKIYDGDKLVMSLFINPNSSPTVNLPTGTFKMNEANGTKWFGDKDMFGDEGSYYTCKFDGEDTFTLRYGYSYEISSSYAFDSSGTGIQNETVDRESF